MEQVSFAREFGALAEASQAGEERSFEVFAQDVEGICEMCDANVELECRCVSLFAESATSTLKCFRWRYRKHPEMFSIEKRIVSSELLIISALLNYVPAVAKRQHEY